MTEFELKHNGPTDPKADDNTQLLTPAQVARWLGVSERWVRDHVSRRSPRIPAVDLGSLKRFRRTDVEAFILERREHPNFQRKK